MSTIFGTIIIATGGAILFANGALAETTTTADPTKPAPAPAITTGSINVEPPFEKRMLECMAIWDKGTHMTKAQWRRTCQTTLRSLSTN